MTIDMNTVTLSWSPNVKVLSGNCRTWTSKALRNKMKKVTPFAAISSCSRILSWVR